MTAFAATLGEIANPGIQTGQLFTSPIPSTNGIGASRLLKVRADELTHWLSVEDTRNETRWAKRLAAWLEARWGG